MEKSVKERIQWCKSFESSKTWLNAVMSDLTGSTYTLENYASGLYRFCQWIGKNPDQLIEDREQEIENEKLEMEDKLREFDQYLKNEIGLKKSTRVTNYWAVIQSFFAYNDRRFPKIPLALNVSTPRYPHARREPHRAEEIRKLMQIASVRTKAIMMILKDSGMSREDVVKLTYGDIKTEFEQGKEFIHLRVVRQKEQIEYDTFLGKNAVEWIKVYLDWRKQRGETITEDSPLIANIRGEPKSISAENLSTAFYRLSQKAGFATSPHRFRKFFASHMALSVPSILVKKWLGHSLGVERAYEGLFLVENQREKYIEGYEEIDLYPTPKIDKDTLRRGFFETIAEMDEIPEWIKKQAEKRDMTPYEYLNVMKMPKPSKEVMELEEEEEDCQKIVEESELEQWLAKGYEVKAVLPSGKIVIENGH